MKGIEVIFIYIAVWSGYKLIIKYKGLYFNDFADNFIKIQPFLSFLWGGLCFHLRFSDFLNDFWTSVYCPFVNWDQMLISFRQGFL